MILLCLDCRISKKEPVQKSLRIFQIIFYEEEEEEEDEELIIASALNLN